MSFTVNNSAEADGGGTTLSVTISIAAGHTVGCVWYFDTFGAGGSVTSITDSGGNTYALGNSTNDGGNHSIGTASSIAIASSVTSVTVHTTGAGGGYLGLWVWDISATGTISLASTAAAFTFPTTTLADGVSTGTLSTTSSDGLIVGAAKDESSAPVTVGTGFTADASGFGGTAPSEHKAITASAAATFTDSQAGDSALAAGLAFQVSGGASGVSVAWWT